MDNFTPNGNGQNNIPQDGSVRNGVPQNGGPQNFARPNIPQGSVNSNVPNKQGINNNSASGHHSGLNRQSSSMQNKFGQNSGGVVPNRPAHDGNLANGQRANVPNSNGQNFPHQNSYQSNRPMPNANGVYPNGQNQKLPNGQNANVGEQTNRQNLNGQKPVAQGVNSHVGNNGGSLGSGKLASGAGKKALSKKVKGILVGVISAIIIAISATVGLFVIPHGEGQKCRITFEDMGPYGARDAIELNVGDKYEAPTLDNILSDDGQENVLVKFKGWLKSDGTPYVGVGECFVY